MSQFRLLWRQQPQAVFCFPCAETSLAMAVTMTAAALYVQRRVISALYHRDSSAETLVTI